MMLLQLPSLSLIFLMQHTTLTISDRHQETGLKH